jgi:hypothetical protein
MGKYGQNCDLANFVSMPTKEFEQLSLVGGNVGKAYIGATEAAIKFELNFLSFDFSTKTPKVSVFDHL